MSTVNQSLIQIGSFNILHPDFAINYNQKEGLDPNGKSNWEQRKDRVADVIANANLDILGLQEISKESLCSLADRIDQLGYVAVFAKYEGKKDGLAILYKKHKFTNLSQNCAQGPAPSYSHLYDKTDCTIKHQKAVFFLDLQDKTTKKVIRIGNCHLDGGPRQQNGIDQINELVKQMNQAPGTPDLKVVVGDFNANEHSYNILNPNDLASKKFTALQNDQYEMDQDFSPTEDAYYQGSPNCKRNHIDWVFAKACGQNTAVVYPMNLYSFYQNTRLEDRASDHHIVGSEICLMSPIQTQTQTQTQEPAKAVDDAQAKADDLAEVQAKKAEEASANQKAKKKQKKRDENYFRDRAQTGIDKAKEIQKRLEELKELFKISLSSELKKEVDELFAAAHEDIENVFAKGNQCFDYLKDDQKIGEGIDLSSETYSIAHTDAEPKLQRLERILVEENDKAKASKPTPSSTENSVKNDPAKPAAPINQTKRAVKNDNKPQEKRAAPTKGTKNQNTTSGNQKTNTNQNKPINNSKGGQSSRFGQFVSFLWNTFTSFLSSIAGWFNFNGRNQKKSS